MAPRPIRLKTLDGSVVNVGPPAAVPVPVVLPDPVEEIVAGHFGSAFLNPPVSMNLAAHGINVGIIDGMFRFETGVTEQCRRSYAQAIMDLTALPTGKNLLCEIITKCHENSNSGDNPNGIVFKNENKKRSFFKATNNAECAINLAWNNTSHSMRDWMLIVYNTDVHKPDLVSVRVPPSLSLAHELGHFLYALETKSTPGTLLAAKIQSRAHGEYDEIFEDIVNLKKKKRSPGEYLFVNSWNNANYVEVMNILPAVDMVQGLQRLRYSDGIFIGEALSSTLPVARRPQFFTLENNDIVVQYNGLQADRFIRFSHRSSVGFQDSLNKLNATEQDKFFGLVENLIKKINVDDVAGRKKLSLNDLPTIGNPNSP
jgi:hypothetical protein